jgi:hypothetical protein
MSITQRDPATTTGSGRMQAAVVVSHWVVWLSLAVAVLAAVATVTGIWWSGGSAPQSVVSVHGETVTLFGEGLYRHDSVFKGAGNRGTDVVMLVLGVPLLLWSVASYRRGSLPGALLLVGALAWTLYLYATLAVGTAYNELFLVYVAIFGASLYALVLTTASVDPHVLSARLADDLPRRGLATLLVAAGLVTLIVWVAPLAAALAEGRPPELLGHSTTHVTEALDLAIIVPACFIAAGLLHRGRRLALACMIAVPLLVLLAVLLPVIVAQTASHLAAGLRFTLPEIIGPIGGFLVLGVAAVVLLRQILRLVAQDELT